MPIPLIPLLLGGAVAASSVFGLKKGADGYSAIKKAKEKAENAQTRGENAVKSLELRRDEVSREAQAYADLMVKVRQETFARFTQFLESLGQRGSMEAIEALEEVNITTPQIKEIKIATIETHRVATGAFSAVGASTGAGAGATGLVGLLGTASTGTAISGLSGAAATNATLAWLGGGSLAAGGGGMAPGRGQKALTEATEYEAKVSKEIANMRAMEDFMKKVIQRIHELKSLLTNIDRRANQSLDKLSPRTFDSEKDEHIKEFQATGLLIKALADITKTPILDQEGHLTKDSYNIQTKYRTIVE
jgi:hypothetical protein